MNRRTRISGALILGAMLVLAGCTNNLFSSFDEPDAGPSASDLRNQYQSATGTTRVQLAAQAGTARITENDDALQTVNNFGGVIETLIDAADNGTEPDPESIIASLFPSNLSEADAQALVTSFKEASTDFSDFAQNVNSVDDPLNSGEKGDVVQMALISLAVNEIVQAGTGQTPTYETQLVELIAGTRSADDLDFSATSTNPFEDLGNAGGDLGELITYAGLGETF